MMPDTIRVLYVDDDPDLLDIGKLFLEGETGFFVDCALSGKEALDRIAAGHYDAVVSDYQMPKMDGITLLKTVRAGFRMLPFILFTGRGREEVVIDALNNGADFYLQKGGDPKSQFAELSHKIRQAVQQRRADKIIHDHERREADILNFLPDATLAIDTHGVVIAWNHAIEEMTGVPAQEMIGKGDHEYAIPFYGTRRPILIDLVFSPEQEIRQMYSFVRAEGDVLTTETNNALPRGKKVILWGKAVPLYDTQGTVIGAIESIRDITERKNLETILEKEHHELHAAYEQVAAAEEELRSQYDQLAESERTLRINEERLTMAQGIGHTGSWEYDIKTNRIWGSAEALHIFGYPPVAGDVPLADIEACIPERDRVHQALVDLITERKEYAIEYTVHPADGSAPRAIHSIARLEKDTGGNPFRVIGVIHDITERKRVEEEITFKNIILSTQQETSPDGILIVDEIGKVLHFNQKFAVIWGIPDNLLASRNDDTLLQYVVGKLADPDAFLSRVRYLYDHKEEKSSEEILLRDGRVLERFSAPMLGETGKYYGRVWYFRDITERRQAEEKIRESETQFHALYINMTEGAALHELTYDDGGVPVDYVILETNPAFEKHLGITREAVIGKTSRQAYGVTEPPYLGIYAKVALTGEPKVFETYFPPLDRYFSISAYRPAKGRFATIFEDITERKKAEDALRESEEKYRLAAEKTGQLIYDYDIPGGKIRWSGAILQVTGFTPEEFPGTDIAGWEGLVHPDDRPAALAELRKATGGAENYRVEYRFLKKDGNYIPMESSGGFITDAAGTAYRMIGTQKDISQKKQMEDDLRKSAEKYRLTLEATNDGFWDWDIPTGSALFSPRWYTMLGYEPDEMPGTHAMWRSLIHPDDLGPVEQKVRDHIGNKDEYYTVEFRMRTKEGGWKWILARGKAIGRDAAGNPVRMVGTHTDITGSKQAEQALASANEKLTLLSSITRHDIANQITALLAYSSLLEKKVADPHCSGYFRKIDLAAQRIAAMIRFTREYEDIGISAPAWQDCRTLIDTVAKDAPLGNVRVVNEIPQGREVFADPLIAKVFYCLMENAARYGGKITTIRFFVQDAGGEHVIVCEDDGEGIPAEDKERIFERGFGKNTGLGLTISREILTITGIAIRETGEPGRGARFEIRVPEGAYRIAGKP